VTPRQRIVLLAIAAVVLVAGVVLAASSGGDDSDEPPGTTGAQTVQTTGPGEEPVEEDDGPPQPRVERIDIRDGKPRGGVKTFRFQRGDTIRLRIRADAPGEVHVHGFDREFAVSASGVRVVNFKANLEGIFEIEEHDTKELLAKLEIRPK
jgi:hypothetical protein